MCTSMCASECCWWSYLQSAWSAVPPGACQLEVACVEPEGEHSPGSAAACLEAD